MKKPKPTKKLSAGDEYDLRRWCIEQAMRWPVDTPYGSSVSSGFPVPRTEADIIGRANRLRDWVTG